MSGSGRGADARPLGQRVRPEDIARRGPVWSRRVGQLLDHVYWNTTVLGKEHVPATGPVIIASNHIGIVDGPVLHGAVPRGSHFLVKQEFFASRIGFLMRWAGQVPTDRASGRAALVVAQRLLEEGRVVGIFPEGNRGRGDLASARAGVAWLALRTGAPVVPVACLGTRPSGQDVGYVPPPRGRLHVVFGAPIDVAALASDAAAPRAAGETAHTADGAPSALSAPTGAADAVAGGAAPARRAAGSGRAAMAAALATVQTGLADHVRDAVRRTGVALPADAVE
ncbi:lysophospholipid acyltransferase family protein [Georgenia faecalis]|uniref:lysophospholipid acyltransferase family protein n=1 Tax=Georgenia faecalis TaxID=2483799 RepID=UPI000FDACAE9|nr:lysophospholipid acyltransferase family protein [Georgenia faecalis]